MASEYLKWKYRDVKPDEPTQLTPQQKRQNWWHYHKWHVVVAVVVLSIAASLVKSAFHIGETLPDYQFAYVGENPLPGDTTAALQSALEAYGTDCNGDGTVYVQLNQYVSAAGGDAQSADYAYASNVTLMGDLELCQSYFFILQDSDAFQENYAILRHLDGTLPGDSLTKDEKPVAFAWTDCPVLRSLELGNYTETALGQEVSGDSQELLSQFRIARRGFWTKQTSEHTEACDQLWDKLTEGAVTK